MPTQVTMYGQLIGLYAKWPQILERDHCILFLYFLFN